MNFCDRYADLFADLKHSRNDSGRCRTLLIEGVNTGKIRISEGRTFDYPVEERELNEYVATFLQNFKEKQKTQLLPGVMCAFWHENRIIEIIFSNEAFQASLQNAISHYGAELIPVIGTVN